ncbi:MAG: LON peptidase substrate-binding domain-containing protein [Myxococcota bacterium]
MTESREPLPPEALVDVPVFPLPGTVLMPRTIISLHVFEPRYRAMTADCIEGHRLMVVAMLDPDGTPDHFGRPRVHSVGGLGALRRSARLPDGRYNIVVEGLHRVDISDELDPGPPYRRARARVLEDVYPPDTAPLTAVMASVRSLCTRALTQSHPHDASELDGLNQVVDPGHLADLVAAAAMTDALERQQVLAEPDVEARLNLVAGCLGAYLLSQTAATDGGEVSIGWGITTGKA